MAISIPIWSDFSSICPEVLFHAELFQSQYGLILVLFIICVSVAVPVFQSQYGLILVHRPIKI